MDPAVRERIKKLEQEAALTAHCRMLGHPRDGSSWDLRAREPFRYLSNHWKEPSEVDHLYDRRQRRSEKTDEARSYWSRERKEKVVRAGDVGRQRED